MRHAFAAALCALTVIACGSSSSPSVAASPTTPSSAAAPTGASAQLKVMTFNMAHGLNKDGQYDLRWVTETIAAINPDIVGVQELTRNHPSYKCEDQPAKIAQGLSAATGRAWNYIYKQEWSTAVVDCKGDTPESEENGFFAPTAITEAGSVSMWNGRNSLETVLNVGRGVPIMTTHLQNGLLAGNSSDRLKQLGTLLPWSQAQGSARILIGDFNASPATPEYQQIHGVYRDAWVDALAAGTAKGHMDGITHKSSRIDYVFYEPANVLELVSVETVETPALIGLEASDHRPVVAVFRVK